MPRVRKTPSQAADKVLLESVGGWLFAGRYTVAELAARCGMSESTLRRRLKNPGTLTLTELRTIAKVCHMKTYTVEKVVMI